MFPGAFFQVCLVHGGMVEPGQTCCEGTGTRSRPCHLWSHISLMHLSVVGTSTHQVPHLGGAAGILCPLLSFKVELWLSCLGSHLLGAQGWVQRLPSCLLGAAGWKSGQLSSAAAQVCESIRIPARGGHSVMHSKMPNQALCPLAKPQFTAGVPTPARISSNSLRALIYWELEKYR